MLTKAQKLYDKEKGKQTDRQVRDEKLNNILQEVGVEIEDVKDKKNTSITDKFSFFIKNFRFKSFERKEFLKRQKALNDIEKLLLKSGTIDDIRLENVDHAILSTLHTGLTKDISNFSIHGFDFFGKIHGKDKIIGDTFGYYKE